VDRHLDDAVEEERREPGAAEDAELGARHEAAAELLPVDGVFEDESDDFADDESDDFEDSDFASDFVSLFDSDEPLDDDDDVADDDFRLSVL
jgi:hypothetical protein